MSLVESMKVFHIIFDIFLRFLCVPKSNLLGGLKVWECTLDLLEYLENNHVDFTGLNVLDLGCGTGLLGILALNKGASSVHFQDYVCLVKLSSATFIPKLHLFLRIQKCLN